MPLPTPPPDAASAVTLWCCPDDPRYGKPMFSVDKCPTVEEADIEYRALPAAAFDALMARVARAESALREARGLLNPSILRCDNFHHAKKDRHHLGEECPAEVRAFDLLARIDALLATPGEGEGA